MAVRSIAAMFSSKRVSFVVPGMETIHGFWARSSASAANWAAVALFRCAVLLSSSTKAWFALRASGVRRGMVLWKSELSNVAFSSIFPLVKGPILPACAAACSRLETGSSLPTLRA
jgi:hypothetical protein